MIDIVRLFRKISLTILYEFPYDTNDVCVSDSQKFPSDNSPAKSNMKKVTYLLEDHNASQSQCIGNESSFIL